MTLATVYPLGPDWPMYLRTPSAANSPMPRPAVPQPLRAPHARAGAPQPPAPGGGES